MIVLHGHKMLAGNFIKTFSGLADAGDYIIAPEALSRLYVQKGMIMEAETEMAISDKLNYENSGM